MGNDDDVGLVAVEEAFSEAGKVGALSEPLMKTAKNLD